jgi:hypothetical protein
MKKWVDAAEALSESAICIGFLYVVYKNKSKNKITGISIFII